MVCLSRVLLLTTGLVWSAETASTEEMHKESLCSIGNMDFGPAITKAGLKIDAATVDCVGPNTLACAVDITAVIESASWIAAYIVSVMGDCTNNVDGPCAKGIAGLVAAIVSSSQASASIALTCPKASEGKGIVSAGDELKPVRIGSCVVDSWQSVWFVARAGILINSAVINCGKDAGSDVCILDSLGVTKSIVAAAHFILGAVNNCQAGPMDYGVACGSSVAKLVASLTGVSASSLAVSNACGGAAPLVAPLPISFSQGGDRRLSNATSQVSETLSVAERNYLAKLNLTEEDLASNPMKVVRLLEAQRASLPKASSIVLV